MERHEFQHNGLRFSYLDAGGTGRVLIALHAHWMEGSTYSQLAEALVPSWRVIAPDQRGHGDTDHASSYTRSDYLGDLSALFFHLGLTAPVVLLGNSLGGVNAYQYAAREPALVRALVIEDIGVEILDDASFIVAWKGVFATREQLAERIGARLLPYVKDSFRHTRDGWQLAFDPDDIVISQQNVSGNYWRDWLASNCPALLIRGSDSPLTSQSHLEDMALRRPHTRFETLKAGHVVHADNPAGFVALVRSFLDALLVTL
jgi:pimeloyl-ACP methyl ester carboxylesterase